LKDEYILALSVSHNSTAAVMRNGTIVSAVCEERSTRKKNFVGYPKNAIDYCLAKSGIGASELSRVAYTTIENPGILIKAQTSTEFTLQDYRDYYGDKYYRKVLNNLDTFDYLRWLRDDPQFNSNEQHFDFSYMTDDVLRDSNLEVSLFREEQRRIVSHHLGIEPAKVEFLDHHTCHAHYAYFGSPFRDQDAVILTLDGWGDGRNQTVWTVKNNTLNLLAESNQNDIGRIYKMATLILGMRPDEHEYKVMGLAAYAKPEYIASAKEVLNDISQINGVRILSKDRPKDLFSYLEENWKIHRFDNIAGAVQAYTEELACALVKAIVDETGIKRLVVSGGIAMNIKMNKAISELEEIKEMFVCGSSGDESLSIGGCYVLNSGNYSNKPLDHLYLGHDIEDEILGFDPQEYTNEFLFKEIQSFSEVAKLLEEGQIIGVTRGRAEFGARALGNRSILADPSKKDSVQKINEAIKNRDFWMPFAVSIMAEYLNEYMENPKKLSSPFMAISFDVKPEKIGDIVAGTHAYDKTCRPQAVTQKSNPNYYALLSAFNELTGIPALLNTSFNLHGHPIVDSIGDAFYTFKNSGLDHLLIQDKFLFSKKT
jgi:carbamoyltransferase